MNPISIICVILKNKKGEILFLKRKNTNYGYGKWSLPGGKIEFGESAEHACIREIKEETNLEISDIKFLFYDNGLPIKGETDMHCIDLYFGANFLGEIKLDNESSEFAWIHSGKMDNFDIAFNQKEVIKKFVLKRN